MKEFIIDGRLLDADTGEPITGDRMEDLVEALMERRVRVEGVGGTVSTGEVHIQATSWTIPPPPPRKVGRPADSRRARTQT